MLSKKRENGNNAKLDTIIGKDFNFKGVLESTAGSLRIDGYYEGEINIGGNVIIGETGQVSGTIIAKNVSISGQVNGNIESRGKLEMAPTAKVMADAKMVYLVVEDGAFFQGQCEPLAHDELKEDGKILEFDSQTQKD